jgi:hypothetical protein
MELLSAQEPVLRQSSSIVGGRNRAERSTLSTVLIIVLISPMIGALPTRPDSSGWGYYPGGRIGLLLIIVIVLTAAGALKKSRCVT